MENRINQRNSHSVFVDNSDINGVFVDGFSNQVGVLDHPRWVNQLGQIFGDFWLCEIAMTAHRSRITKEPVASIIGQFGNFCLDVAALCAKRIQAVKIEMLQHVQH